MGRNCYNECDNGSPYAYLTNNGSQGNQTVGVVTGTSGAYVYDNVTFDTAVVGHGIKTFLDGTPFGGVVIPETGLYEVEYYVAVQGATGAVHPSVALLLRNSCGNSTRVVTNSAINLEPNVGGHATNGATVIFKAKRGDQLSLVNNSLTVPLVLQNLSADNTFANPPINASITLHRIE